MPKLDITGKTVQQAKGLMGRLRSRIDESIPYGPTRKFLTSQEIRVQLQNMDPNQKSELMTRVGPEEWDRMMADLYGQR